MRFGISSYQNDSLNLIYKVEGFLYQIIELAMSCIYKVEGFLYQIIQLTMSCLSN
jgi:hypothetical protein